MKKSLLIAMVIGLVGITAYLLGYLHGNRRAAFLCLEEMRVGAGAHAELLATRPEGKAIQLFRSSTHSDMLHALRSEISLRENTFATYRQRPGSYEHVQGGNEEILAWLRAQDEKWEKTENLDPTGDADRKAPSTWEANCVTVAGTHLATNKLRRLYKDTPIRVQTPAAHPEMLVAFPLKEQNAIAQSKGLTEVGIVFNFALDGTCTVTTYPNEEGLRHFVSLNEEKTESTGGRFVHKYDEL